MYVQLKLYSKKTFKQVSLRDKCINKIIMAQETQFVPV